MVVFDIVEDILCRSDVNDVLRCKSVCKSWYSLISSHPFVKSHLKKTCSGSSKTGHTRRILMPRYWKTKGLYQWNKWQLVGSSNGLICVSRMLQDGLILVNNPLTREIRKVPLPPMFPEKVYGVFTFLSLSFGYDPSIDDYKIVMGIKKDTDETLIQVLSLKSNTWKIIPPINHSFFHSQPGILFNGAFYWIAFTCKNDKFKRSIASFHLSREDFTIIPQPRDSKYFNSISLGILDNQLCVYSPDDTKDLAPPIWVMRSYNGKLSWETLPYDIEMKYGVVHSIKMLEFTSPKQKRMNFFCADDDECLSPASKYVSAHVYMPSLVSPYVNSARPSHPTNNKTIVNAWTFEAVKGQCPHILAKKDVFIKADEQIEEIYRLEAGEVDNLYLHEDVHLQENKDRRDPL